MKNLVTKSYSILFAIVLSCIGTITVNAQTWSPANSMAQSRYVHTATVLSNGKVLITGGAYNGNVALKNCELYDPATNIWSTVASMAGSRYFHTATVLPNGKVLVAGGTNGSNFINSCELYDPATNTWSAAPSMANNHYAHTSTVLSNGKVLVTGGYNGNQALNNCELYDPATNTWSAAPSMTFRRYYHTATVLSNGKVLVTGGIGSVSSSCELYDPGTNTWGAATSMAGNHYFHTATVLSNGKVLVTGGSNGIAFTTSCELFDPITNTWGAAASMANNRGYHKATLLSDGKVLVIGGYNGIGVLNSCELFDPATNSWSETASMVRSRYAHTSTLLSNGKVLVTGGYSGSAFLTSCEIFDPSPPCIAPTFSECPSDQSANTATGTCAATVIYTASAIGSPAPTVSYAFTGATTGIGTGTGSSQTFNKGITHVTITATNSCGTINCDFTITVSDHENPQAYCKPVTVTLENGTANITVSDVNNNSFDNCGIASIMLSKYSFNCNDLGTNNVTLTVKDMSDNLSTCTAIVTVLGEIPTCSITAVPSNSTYTGGIPTNIYIGYGPQSVTLNVSAPARGAPYTYSWSGGTLGNYTTANPVFTATTAGSYTYTVQITNNYGCTTTCKINICVTDARVPGTSGNSQKVYLCHLPSGNPNNLQTLAISINAVAGHLTNHPGDHLGSCNQTCEVSQAITARKVIEEKTITSYEGLSFNVYPSPNNGKFVIDISTTEKGELKLAVIDMMGRIVYRQNQKISGPENIPVNLEDEPQGLYLVKVEMNGQLQVKHVMLLK